MFKMGDGKASFKETGIKKKHSSFKRHTLSSQRTLGSGVTAATVKTPEGEDPNEWIATNILDFLKCVFCVGAPAKTVMGALTRAFDVCC